ncbi:MAG: helix-turn-helix transcriptional regulator [Acetobacter orientalis]|uniref:helix-turn-helix domain-containing protein n=1 Tax=Acetobacter orientalis TaxID=146474 RepID=UPI0039ED76EA
MITGTQLRMARAALRLGVRELAEEAKISPATISRIEGGYPANVSTLNNLEWTLARLGVLCSIDDNGGALVRASSTVLSESEHTAVQKALDEKRTTALKTAQERVDIEERERARQANKRQKIT